MRFAGTVDIFDHASRQATNYRSTHRRRDGLDRFKIALGTNREPRFDDIDAHRFEMPGDFDFFQERERRAGRLLTITQRRIENLDGIHCRSCGKK